MGIALNIDTSLTVEVARLMDAVAACAVRPGSPHQLDETLAAEIRELTATTGSFRKGAANDVGGGNFAEAEFISFEELLDSSMSAYKLAF